MVCTAENCKNQGLICAKCIEESHSHSNSYIQCLDDIISTCQKIAQPILSAHSKCSSLITETHQDNAFHRLDIVSGKVINVLRDFSSTISMLASSLEINIKQHLIDLRKNGLTELSEIGDFISFIHSIQTPIHLLQNTCTFSYKNQQKIDHQNLNMKTNPFQGIKQNKNQFTIATSVNTQNKLQSQFSQIVRNIVSRLQVDPKLKQIKSLTKYIDECEVGLAEYYENLRAETHRIIEETKNSISHYSFKQEKANKIISTIKSSIISIPEDIVYSGIEIEQHSSVMIRSIYKGAPLKWIDLIDQIKNIPLNQTLIVTLTSSPTEQVYPSLSKFLKTTVYKFLNSENLLSNFTLNLPNKIKILEISEYEEEDHYLIQSDICAEEDIASNNMVSTVNSIEIPTDMIQTSLRFQSISQCRLESEQFLEEQMGKSNITEVIRHQNGINPKLSVDYFFDSIQFLQNEKVKSQEYSV